MSNEREPVVLVVLANVVEAQPLPHVMTEAGAIQRALDPPFPGRRVAEVRTLESPTVEVLFDELRRDADQRRIRVFHFAGHANAVSLVLAGLTGGPAVGHAEGLAKHLGQQDGLTLAVLNGCSTRAQIEGLRRAGVGAVVATTRAIKDGAAATFASAFYRHLASMRLGAAFEAAKNGVETEHGGTLRELVDDAPDVMHEWAEPRPWVLAHAPKLERWRLARVSAQELADELSRVFSDLDNARMLVGRIGFPRGWVPSAPNAMVFWSEVVRMLEDGALGAGRDGVQALVDEASRLFPGNRFLAEHCT